MTRYVASFSTAVWIPSFHALLSDLFSARKIHVGVDSNFEQADAMADAQKTKEDF